MLTSILSNLIEEDDQVRYIAALILKNTIKTYFPRLNECFTQELKEVEYLCYVILVREANGHVLMSKKNFNELTSIIVNIIKRRFFEDANDFNKNELLISVIAEY